MQQKLVDIFKPQKPQPVPSSPVDAIPLLYSESTNIPTPVQQGQPPRRSYRQRTQPEVFGRDYGYFSNADSFVQEGTLAFCYKSVVDFLDDCPNSLRDALDSTSRNSG